MEINADPLRQTPSDDNVRITVEEAVRDFLADEEARQLAKTTACQSRTLLQQQLLPWAKSQTIVFLDQLTTPRLREFRASWLVVRGDYLRDCDFRRFAGTPLRLLVTGFVVLAASNKCRMPCSNSSTALSKAPSCPTRTIATDKCNSNEIVVQRARAQW
jgi:hypothetical protein